MWLLCTFSVGQLKVGDEAKLAIYSHAGAGTSTVADIKDVSNGVMVI